MIYFISNDHREFSSDEITMGSFSQLRDCLQDSKFIGVDTETTGLDPHSSDVLLLQVGDYHNQFVIDCTCVDPRELRDFFLDPDRVFLFANAKFDVKMLWKFGIHIDKLYDLWIAESEIYRGYRKGIIKKGLADMASRYLNVQMDKNIREEFIDGLVTEAGILYSAKDVKYLRSIMVKQLIKIKQLGIANTVRLENQHVKAMAYFEWCGLYLNTTKWKQKYDEDVEDFESKLEIFNSWLLENVPHDMLIFGKDGKLLPRFFNKRVSTIPIFEALGVDVEVENKDKGAARGFTKKSIAQGVMKDNVHVSPLVQLYLDVKEADTVLTKYGNKFLDNINEVTGRIHPDFNQMGADTGRISSSNPNLQNIPANDRTRHCFTPQLEDNILIDCDYSAQEVVVFANKTQDRNLVQFLLDGNDPHGYLATLCFPEELEGVHYNDVKKVRSDLRSAAKGAEFAIQYGGWAGTIARNLKIGLDKGKFIEAAYHKAFPDVNAWFNKVRISVLRHGAILTNAVSRRRINVWFFQDYLRLKSKMTREWWQEYKAEREIHSKRWIEELEPLKKKVGGMEGEMKRMAYNYPVQGTSGDMTKIAGTMLYNWIYDNGYFDIVKMVVVVHDEIMVECPKSMADEVANVLKRCMEEAGALFCKTVTLKAEPCITDVWNH